MTLNQLTEGQIGHIQQLSDTNTALLRQCGILGLVPGASVKVLRRARGKGPMQVKCDGTLYAIRAEEAAQIHMVVA
ncbi:MAG: FeoA family protein [Marinagarivorans sp.]|nr:FeoA family protein [Marinagarivorans sp.]